MGAHAAGDVGAASDRVVPLRLESVQKVSVAGFNGDVYGAGERITREEAIRLYTSAASRYSFSEAKTGSIEPGKYADMAVISDDILTVPEEAIKDIKAVQTIIEGRTVYARAN